MGCLKLVEGAEELVIPKTDGKRTFASAKDVFFFICGNFQLLQTDVPDGPRGETRVQVSSIVSRSTFLQIIEGTERPFEELCLTQDQAIQFILDHRAWLCNNGCSTFFPFMVKEQRFFAGVFRRGTMLRVRAYRFEDLYLWHSAIERRIVLRSA